MFPILSYLYSRFPFSFFPLNLVSSLQLSFQCLSRLVAHLYHCLILVRGLSISINFFLITPFIPFLNFSTNVLFSYLLFLAAFLNSYTNFLSSLLSAPSFWVLLLWPIFLFHSPNSLVLKRILLLTQVLLILILNFLTNSPSANLLYTYDNIH